MGGTAAGEEGKKLFKEASCFQFFLLRSVSFCGLGAQRRRPKKHVGVEVLVGAGVVGAGVAVGAAGGGLALGADQESQVLAVRRQEGVHR